MSNVLGIDPGLRCTGVAWHVNNKIGWLSIRPKTTALIDRVREITQAVSRVISEQRWSLVVIEKPQVYQRSKQKGDPNDLIDLTLVVGAIMAHVEGELELPRPNRWKGQVPKHVHHRRIRQRVPIDTRVSSDAMDAVGLVLYGLEKLNYARPQT